VWATVNVQSSDTTAPVVNITSPSSNQNVALDVKITANATDASGINYVDFYVDNVKKWTDSTYPYEYNWSISGYGDGYHVIYASAVDNSANRMTGKSMQIRVNKITPTYCTSIADAKHYPDPKVVAVYGRIVSGL
jgi:leucyl aminopeptidase